MIAMIFEFWLDPQDKAMYEEYLAESGRLRELLPEVDGFLGIERFQSVAEPGKFVAIGFFRDEAAVAGWRNLPEHRRAQVLGRTRFFSNYRLRMAEVIRDYGPLDRVEAPADSYHYHDGGPQTTVDPLG